MIKEFCNYMVMNKGCSELTAAEYSKDLALFVGWLRESGSAHRWRDVTRAIVERWVSEMSESGLAASTIKRRVSAVRGLYQYAWLQGLTVENPAKWVSTPKKIMRTPRTVPAADIAAAINDEQAPMWARLAVALIAETGMRVSECRTLTAQSIDLESRTIHVMGKGRKERYVMYGELSASLLQHTPIISGTLFEQGDYEFRHAIWALMRKHTRAEKCSAHKLRHTFASEMLRNGAPIESISLLLGHASVKTTEIYAHSTLTRVRQDYERAHPIYGGASMSRTSASA